MKRRNFLKGTSVLAGSVFVGSGALWSTASAQGMSILTLAYPATFPDLDPSTSFSDEITVLANVYETLVRYVPGKAGGDPTLEPVLAESWEISEDGLTWTFKLREGVAFHDGEALTSEAVRASIQRTIDIDGGASFIWASITGMETPDPLTIVFNLSNPQPMDLVASAGFGAWIMSPATVDKDAAWFNAGNAAGTGPYQMSQYEAGQRVVLRRFDGYWGGFPDGAFDILNIEVIEDPVLAQNMIEAGDADWTMGIPYENLEALDARPDVTVVTKPSYENLLGLYNTRKAPLNDARVRQALSLALPYDDVIEAGTAGMATRANGAIPPGIWGRDDEAVPVQTDLEAAGALLAEAGVSGLELTVTYAAADPIQQTIGELWRANLEKIGITLLLQPMTWEAQWELAKSGPEQAQDIFLFYWWPTYVTPYDYFFSMFHSEEETLFNLSYYANPNFDDLINEANVVSGTDRQKASEMFVEAQRILTEDAVAAFILDTPAVFAVRSDLRGYEPNPAYGRSVAAGKLSR